MCLSCRYILTVDEFLGICDRLMNENDVHTSTITEHISSALVPVIAQIVARYTNEAPLMISALRNLTIIDPYSEYYDVNMCFVTLPAEYNDIKNTNMLISLCTFPASSSRLEILVYIRVFRGSNYGDLLPMYESYLALCGLPSPTLSESMYKEISRARCALLEKIAVNPQYLCSKRDLELRLESSSITN